VRVLHVHSGNLYGGVETLLVTLARCRELCPSMDPHFALCYEGRLSEELSAAAVPVHRLGEVRTRRPFSILRGRRKVTNIIREQKIDVAICHSTWPQAMFGAAIRKAGTPSVFWLHNITGDRHWLQRWARMSVPDFVVCNSRFTQSTLFQMYPRVRNAVIYVPIASPQQNGFSKERLALRNEFKIPEGAVAVLQTSRMEEWKGHRLLLKALALLADIPNWVAYIAGGAQRPSEVRYLDALKQDAAHLGIADRVIFLGQCSDVPRLLAAADIHCQPNIGAEPFGICFVEALYAGIPVVSTAIGAAKEIIDQSCGVLVPPNNPGALAESLAELMSNVSLRKKLGAAGPVRARQLCDPATQLSRVSTMLTSVCQGSD
jgi:glycosyltransferase involved in cell wall biosynthesis